MGAAVSLLLPEDLMYGLEKLPKRTRRNKSHSMIEAIREPGF